MFALDQLTDHIGAWDIFQKFGVFGNVDDGQRMRNAESLGVANFVDFHALCLLLDVDELESELVFEVNVKDVIDHCVDQRRLAFVGRPQ